MCTAVGRSCSRGVAEVPAGCSITSATWDPGDGSGPQPIAFSNPRALELRHTYTGLVGQPFVATLEVTDSCGTTASDTFRVRVQDNTLGTRVNMAIDTGLWYLHKQMTLASSNGVPTGRWTSGSSGAATSSAALAFQVHGHLESGDRSEDPYVDNVARGLAHCMTELSSITIGLQGMNNPDVNGNGIGLRAVEDPTIYIMGQIVDAIAASGTPDAVALTGGTNVLNRTYRDIVQDIMEAYYWGQVDGGSARGGWRYNLNSEADNSACQWAAIGALGAVRQFGHSVPPFVKVENLIWLGFSQNTDGRFGYGNSSGCVDIACMNTTPSGMVQLAMNDIDRSDPRWMLAEGYMERNFSQLRANNRIYGMFSTAKAMRLALPQPITLLNGNLDWYADPNRGLAPHLVATQLSNGSWNGSRWVTGELASAWALVILSPTIFCQAPIARCDADPQTTGVGVPITFDGTQSVATVGTIQEWEWGLRWRWDSRCLRPDRANLVRHDWNEDGHVASSRRSGSTLRGNGRLQHQHHSTAISSELEPRWSLHALLGPKSGSALDSRRHGLFGSRRPNRRIRLGLRSSAT